MGSSSARHLDLAFLDGLGDQPHGHTKPRPHADDEHDHVGHFSAFRADTQCQPLSSGRCSTLTVSKSRARSVPKATRSAVWWFKNTSVSPWASVKMNVPPGSSRAWTWRM